MVCGERERDSWNEVERDRDMLRVDEGEDWVWGGGRYGGIGVGYMNG